MNIRRRLAILAIQLAVLAIVSHLVTGTVYAKETWYFAGLLAIVINPQLLEPFYSRPVDIIANSIIFFALAATETKTITTPGWFVAGGSFGIATLLSIIALVFGAGKRFGKYSGFANGARILSQFAGARVIYSTVFLLSVVEFKPTLDADFWKLVFGWAGIMVLGIINWQAVWTTTRGREQVCVVEGMIGPSSLLVSAPDLPAPGSSVSLKGRALDTFGVVINRIRRVADTWGQIHIGNSDHCESILAGQTLTVMAQKSEGNVLIGSVDAGSSDKSLKFLSLRALEVGQVVGVAMGNPHPYVLYQLSSAMVERSDVKGGSHLVIRATGNQLGVFNEETLEFKQHRWVSSPGGPIYDAESLKKIGETKTPADSLLLGHVIGTDIPIFLNCSSACEGHVALLGMTKMGKSTLAARLAQELSKSRRVTILDQTGEYVSKKGFPPCNMSADWKSPGLSVFEPKPGEVAADRALNFLEYLVKIAVEEYKAGTPFPRVVIIDEAHQFIPEPAGLGFNAPGRDSSFKIGLLLMQIRKYGISAFLISQRTAVVAKSALSQCENLIAFRSVDQTGLDYLEAIAGGEIRSLLPQLRQGEALVFGPAISADGAVAIQVANPQPTP